MIAAAAYSSRSNSQCAPALGMRDGTSQSPSRPRARRKVPGLAPLARPRPPWGRAARASGARYALAHHGSTAWAGAWPQDGHAPHAYLVLRAIASLSLARSGGENVGASRKPHSLAIPTWAHKNRARPFDGVNVHRTFTKTPSHLPPGEGENRLFCLRGKLCNGFLADFPISSSSCPPCTPLSPVYIPESGLRFVKSLSIFIR